MRATAQNDGREYAMLERRINQEPIKDTTARAARSLNDLSWTEPGLDAAVPDESSMDAATRQHSDDNILRWMKYLPDDCIETMIAMGWDVST